MHVRRLLETVHCRSEHCDTQCGLPSAAAISCRPGAWRGVMEEQEPEYQAAAVAEHDKAPLQTKKLQKLQRAYEKRGILYVSRIPPHMVSRFAIRLEGCRTKYV